ncbi:MAG: 3-hydroxyacyl-ACP dehydratase FabZ [bacterium]|nr:3-hydroxyacyl-ACP dehydratase FabZ [bacterium]
MSLKVLSLTEIKELLPYRYPMLLIDRMWHESETKYFGLKNITATENYFIGHFPNHPIMPGVLQIEATFQVAVVALRKDLDPGNKFDIYIKSMKKAKFRKPTYPGDRLLIELDIISVDGDEAVVKAVNKNNSGVCCQVEMIISIRPRVYEVNKPELFTQYDKSENIVMDVNDIKSYIPHRYPFLFVDYIAKENGSRITAIKNITYNEPITHSYSSGFSVLSGAIQCEIIAQAGCARTLSKPENKGKIALFMTINKAEFYHPVHPGDQLRIELELPETKSRFGKGAGEIYVDSKKVSYGEITFAVVDA